MTTLLGLPLERATDMLTKEKTAFTLKEVRSKKGTDGDDLRVIRQTVKPDGTMELCFAAFRTKLQDEE